MIVNFFEYIKENYINHDIDKILDSYLETALWCEGDNDEYEDKYISDFSDKAIQIAKEEITWFINASGDILDNISDDIIGSNIWYEREEYGVGFWDKDFFTDDEKFILGKLADALGSSDMYVADDGKIEFGNSAYQNFNLDKFKEEIKLKKDIRKFNL